MAARNGQEQSQIMSNLLACFHDSIEFCRTRPLTRKYSVLGRMLPFAPLIELRSTSATPFARSAHLQALGYVDAL